MRDTKELKGSIYTTPYLAPTFKSICMKHQGILCSSYSVSPTEIDPADRDVTGGYGDDL